MIIPVRQSHSAAKPDGFSERREDMDEGMTNTELRVLLEMLAQLVESKATSVQDAATLIRQFKPE